MRTYRKRESRKMNAEEVLENWTDIENDHSNVSDVSSDESEEVSSDEEDDDNSQTRRKASGL